MDRRVSFVFVLACCMAGHAVVAIHNGLGRTPAMGYNTWYDHGCTAYTEAQVCGVWCVVCQYRAPTVRARSLR